MTKPPKKKPPKNEDPEQSQRFLDLARDLEAAGELSRTESGEAFERLVGKIAPARPTRPRQR